MAEFNKSINECMSLADKIRIILKASETQEFELFYENYYDDEEMFEDKDTDENARVYSDDFYDLPVFCGTGWSYCDDIYIKKVYLDGDDLMFDFWNYKYDPWCGEFAGELYDGWDWNTICDRFNEVFTPDGFINAFKDLIERMKGVQ